MASLIHLFNHLSSAGEFLSVASGLAWAVGIILFRVSGRSVPPVGLNIFKNIVGLIFVVPTMFLLGEKLDQGLKPGVWGLFILSGVLGIAVSDTLLLAALNKLGAGLLAIVDCFYSPFVILLSFAFLGEKMTVVRIVGALMIIGAVLTAARSEGSAGGPVTRKDMVAGFVLGILSVAFVAVGIIIVKPYMPLVPAAWSAMVRIAGGLAALLVFLPFYKGRAAAVRPLLKPANWKAMIPAGFFGTYLSLVFWMGGMKYTLASIAAVLNQTNVVFAVILAAIFLKEKMDGWKTAAVVLALAGAFLTAGNF